MNEIKTRSALFHLRDMFPHLLLARPKYQNRQNTDYGNDSGNQEIIAHGLDEGLLHDVRHDRGIGSHRCEVHRPS